MEKKCFDTSLISSKSISLLCYNNDDCDCDDDFKDNFNDSIPKHLKKLCDMNELNEINGLQTPVLNKTFDDKSFSSCILKNNIASSTPITSISCNYKTPEGKRKLFGSNTSNSVYLPVSSPSSSELYKLSDSHFLNNSSLFYKQQSKLNDTLFNKETDEEEFNCTLHADSFNCDFNSSVLNNDYNKENCHQRTFHCSYNNSVNLKFKSFDLLPGITPLSDNLDLLSNNLCNNCNGRNE